MSAIPLCNHVMPNGNTCGSPALRNQRFCYFHQEQHKRAKRIMHCSCPFHPRVPIHPDRHEECPMVLAAHTRSKPATCDL
jgi:hypothetical protein